MISTNRLGKNFALNKVLSEKLRKESEEPYVELSEAEEKKAREKQFAEWRAADKKWDANEKKIDGNYAAVFPQEGTALDVYLMRWLKHRLPLVKIGWEKTNDIDKVSCPEQHKEYNELCELIKLTDYILAEGWDNEFERPANEKNLLEILKEIEPDEKGNKTLPPSSPEMHEYHKNVWEAEWKARERWLEIFGKLFWRLGW